MRFFASLIGVALAASAIAGEVVVTVKELIVTSKTPTGAPVKEKTGAVCAPLVSAAR